MFELQRCRLNRDAYSSELDRFLGHVFGLRPNAFLSSEIRLRACRHLRFYS